MMARSIRPSLRIPLAGVFAVFLLTGLSALAQQQPPPTPAASSDQSKSVDKNNADPKAKDSTQSGTSNDRLFYTLPNFLTVQVAGQLPPLTTAQKFKVVTRSAFDYVEIPWYGALAGISQAQNSEPGYGQGGLGYAKRFGSQFADGTIENYMTSAVFPSVLKQDPRFYQSGTGGFWHRTGYSVTRIFVTYSDSGHKQFNYSEIFGSALAASISNYSYHPRGDRNLTNTAGTWGTQVGYDTLTYFAREFWPDIRRKLRNVRHREPAGS